MIRTEYGNVLLVNKTSGKDFGKRRLKEIGQLVKQIDGALKAKKGRNTLVMCHVHSWLDGFGFNAMVSVFVNGRISQNEGWDLRVGTTELFSSIEEDLHKKEVLDWTVNQLKNVLGSINHD